MTAPTDHIWRGTLTQSHCILTCNDDTINLDVTRTPDNTLILIGRAPEWFYRGVVNAERTEITIGDKFGTRLTGIVAWNPIAKNYDVTARVVSIGEGLRLPGEIWPVEVAA